jgi:hypothetical protein
LSIGGRVEAADVIRHILLHSWEVSNGRRARAFPSNGGFAIIGRLKGSSVAVARAYGTLARWWMRLRPMTRKPKTYQTSLGFSSRPSPRRR